MAWAVVLPAAAETLTYAEFLRRVISLDAKYDVAGLKLERTRAELVKAESQLNWTLSGQGGVGRDLSLFGTITDRADASLSADRRLSFGPQIGVSAGITRDDSATTLSPLIPNPSNTTRADVFWRQPLARGFGNPAYREGRVIAETSVQAAAADRVAAFDDVARRAADIFFAAAYTHVRLRNAAQAIARAERLKNYVQRNQRLGIAEEKDRLQAQAQLDARRAEHEALLLVWTQQRTSLNRLLEQAWDAELNPSLSANSRHELPAAESLFIESEQHSPQRLRLEARARQAEAVIGRNRDSARDQFDAVLSLGSRQLSGDVTGGSVDNSDAVGSLRFEYRGVLGQSGADAELNQAVLDRSIAQRQLESVRTDLRYNVSGLVAEVTSAQAAHAQARQRLESERAKVEEATTRYRSGRSDTAQLIQFENDALLAELLAEQQAIELARRLVEIDVLRGALWSEHGLTTTSRETP
jgi:outer membrane protein TolC